MHPQQCMYLSAKIYLYYGNYINLHGYCNYANEYFSNFLNWGQWFLVKEERDVI